MQQAEIYLRKSQFNSKTQMSKVKTSTQNSKLKIKFLGTPSFVQGVKQKLGKLFILVDSLYEAHLAVIAAYGRILSKAELNTPKYGCINIHPSLLPKYRGPSPIQSAILKGDKLSGITIIKMDEKIDHGPIIYQEQIELSDYDNFDTLSNKMFLRAGEILPGVINDLLQGKIKLSVQNHRYATYCKQLTKQDGYFDINTPPSPEILDRMIRAFYPWPGVWTRFRQGFSGQARIVKFLPNGLIQMEGKKVMPMKDFLNGYPDFPIKQY